MSKRWGEYESTFGNPNFGESVMKTKAKKGNQRSKKLTQTQERFGADSAHDYIEEERKSYASSSQHRNGGFESDEGVMDQMPNFNRNAFGGAGKKKIAQSSKKKMKSINKPSGAKYQSPHDGGMNDSGDDIEKQIRA
jgi:hypothetical protein